LNAIEGTVRVYFNPMETWAGKDIPAGPWSAEPSKVQWVDRDTNLPCLIVRGGSGALCGYAGIFPDHPCHGKHYDEVTLDAHGGLTFADGCGHGEDESRGVCHVPEPGTADNVWWFGFDCAHCYDLTPADMVQPMASVVVRETHCTYRNIEYVARGVADLSKQLSQLAQ
jgi:hypothetical protein